MPNQQTLAGMITGVIGGIGPFGVLPIDGPVQVDVTSGNQAFTLRLPPDASPFSRWAVHALQQMERPVYLTVAAGDIVDVRIPIVGRVSKFVELADGSIAVAIDSSPRRLVLPSAARDGQVGALLERAWLYQGIVMVDADGLGGIDHVDPAPWQAWHLAPTFDPADAEPFGNIALAPVQANELPAIFALVNRACGIAPPDSCIPFDYPDTGCNARAHKMCTILAENNIEAAKVWLFDPHMHIATRNYQGGCDIGWEYHVTAYVRLQGAGTASARVIDPALFENGPVTFDGFISALHASASLAKFSRAEFYQLGSTGGSRERTNQCDDDLAWLREEAAKRSPQPPYC